MPLIWEYKIQNAPRYLYTKIRNHENLSLPEILIQLIKEKVVKIKILDQSFYRLFLKGKKHLD